MPVNDIDGRLLKLAGARLTVTTDGRFRLAKKNRDRRRSTSLKPPNRTRWASWCQTGDRSNVTSWQTCSPASLKTYSVTRVTGGNLTGQHRNTPLPDAGGP